ncbi:hypothetical protein M427DRAFT_53811 [Gonapodya prolifera JEL478]|uniref:DNA polymerase epsilon subunit D n=1 Tax=Gonapodya prolifera (strain JEL478) TaxID=1344416 RepID=A0A139APK9_GONPJ|nr:hypothetical protein M427DRAFT_53811 [Gonapodya prolifera JEL478]|eukprot:KXS18425.1 hypothetical protein M427DRAFT_53811 [Gonapodya prolifera JEL478]
MADADAEVEESQIGYDSLKLATATVNRLIKSSLPPNTQISKDASKYFGVAATVFVSFLTFHAVSSGRQALLAKRKPKKGKAKEEDVAKAEKPMNIQAADILRGFEQAELGDEFMERLQEKYQEYRTRLADKKAANGARRAKPQITPGDAGDTDGEEPSEERTSAGRKRKSTGENGSRVPKMKRVEGADEPDRGQETNDEEDEGHEEEDIGEEVIGDDDLLGQEQDVTEAETEDDLGDFGGYDSIDFDAEETRAGISHIRLESDSAMDENETDDDV